MLLTTRATSSRSTAPSPAGTRAYMFTKDVHRFPPDDRNERRGPARWVQGPGQMHDRDGRGHCHRRGQSGRRAESLHGTYTN
jgi:hypothetical protein